MTIALHGQTVLPPEEPHEELTALASALDRAHRHGGGPVQLLDSAGNPVAVPEVIQDVLHDVVQALEQGRAITVAPHDTELTTQEVGIELGISRPTVVKLLERGESPFARHGNRRKVQLADVRAYQDRMRHTAHAELDSMSADGEDDGLYDDTAEPIRTR